jgi:hypothetical protein
MSELKALIVLIEADATLFLRLGGNVFARQARQGVTPPFAVLNRISREGFDTLDGPSQLARRRVQVDVYAHTEAEMVAIANRLREVLCAVAHQDVEVSDESPAQTLRVQAISLLNDNDLPEEPGHKRLFRRSMDFSVSYNE